MFYFEKFHGKEVLKSDLLDGVNHFFTTREFPLKTKEDDLIDVVSSNLALVKSHFDLDFLVSPEQRHTDNIDVAQPKKSFYSETDALVLSDKSVGIFLNFADCTPVILYDKNKKVAGIAHAGWRGTAKKIVQETFFKMKDLYGSEASDIFALVGPHICFDCFETSEEIMNVLSDTVSNSAGLIKEANSKFYADLGGINKAQLNEIGIQNVDVAPYCTCCNVDKFFSYRKENKTTNRISAFICLK